MIEFKKREITAIDFVVQVNHAIQFCNYHFKYQISNINCTEDKLESENEIKTKLFGIDPNMFTFTSNAFIKNISFVSMRRSGIWFMHRPSEWPEKYTQFWWIFYFEGFSRLKFNWIKSKNKTDRKYYADQFWNQLTLFVLPEIRREWK